MRRTRLLLAALAAAVSLGLTGCGISAGIGMPVPYATVSPSASPASCASLVSLALGCTSYRAVSARDANGVLGWVADAPFTVGGVVVGGADRLQVTDACGTEAWAVSVSFDTIAVDPASLGGTTSGCTGPAADHHAWMRTFVAEPMRFSLAGGHLAVSNALGEIRFDAVRTPLPALARVPAASAPAGVDAQQVGDIRVAWSSDHRTVYLTTTGSSACPLVPMSYLNENATLVLGIDLTHPGACIADSTPITTSFTAPDRWSIPRPVIRSTAGSDVLLTIG